MDRLLLGRRWYGAANGSEADRDPPGDTQRFLRSSAGHLHQQPPCRSVTVRFQGLYGRVGTNTPWQAQPPSGDRAGHALSARDSVVTTWTSADALEGRGGPFGRLGANL